MVLVPYYEFIRIPVEFYKTMGRDILKAPKRSLRKKLFFHLLYYGGLLNYVYITFFQLVYFVFILKAAEYLVAYSMFPSIGFGIVAFFKMMTLHMNKLSIRDILKRFKAIYPKTLKLQIDYQLEPLFTIFRPMMKLYAGLCLFNTFYYMSFPLINSFFKSLIFGIAYDFPMPLYIWYPYEPDDHWGLYFITYFGQLYATILTACSYLIADLLLVSSVEQLCLHFSYISFRFEQFEPSSDEKDRQFLRSIVRHHIKCLELSNSVDTVFGFSLLLNFLTSSATMCFVGFQMTSLTTAELLHHVVLMVVALAQVFIICFYGNKLISSSQGVGDAAYGHDWFNCSLEYRKMVVLIIARSQKIAAIHAPTFPPISLETFMKVISMSYQFFAVIQTTAVD